MWVRQRCSIPPRSTEVLKPAYDTGKNAAEMCAEYYKQVPNCCELSKKQYLDMNMWLPGDILLKGRQDVHGAFSGASRPFLDKKVMEFAEHIPPTTVLTKKAASSFCVTLPTTRCPTSGQRAEKVGFPVPVKFWLREQKVLRLRKGILHRTMGCRFL